MTDALIEYVPDDEDGPRRRFVLVMDITFRGGSHPYYSNDDLQDMVERWVARALDDRDDSPEARLHALPVTLEADVRAWLDMRAAVEGGA